MVSWAQVPGVVDTSMGGVDKRGWRDERDIAAGEINIGSRRKTQSSIENRQQS